MSEIHEFTGQPLRISPTAARAVRLQFNPSASDTVNRIKRLTAALVTELEVVQAQAQGGLTVVDNVEAAAKMVNAIDTADKAIDHVVTASMWSVLAATATL
jgi:hypothetical protein